MKNMFKNNFIFLYFYDIASFPLFITKENIMFLLTKRSNLYQRQKMPEKIIKGEQEKNTNSSEKNDVIHISLIEKENNFKYYNHICKFKDELLREKWGESLAQINRVKGLFKIEKVDLIDFIDGNPFHKKFKEIFLLNPDTFKFEDQFSLAFKCLEKSIEIFHTRVEKCTLIIYLKFFFQDSSNFLMNRKKKYILKTVTLFLYALNDLKTLDITLFYSLVLKITNLKYINYGKKEVYDNFSNNFADLFYAEMLDFSKDFLLDRMACKKKLGKTFF